MLNKRKILGIFIIIISVIISLGLINSNNKDEEKISKKYINPSSNPFFQFNSNKEIDKIIIKEEDKTNLTGLMASSYLEEIKKENPNGFDSKSNQLMVPSLNTLNLDTEKLNQEIDSIFNEDKFSINDIKISKSKTERDYLKEIINFSENNFNKFNGDLSEAIDNFISYQDDTLLKKYVLAASDQVSQILKTETPESLSDIHLNLLNFWYKKLVIFNSLLETENDPLKGVLALERIPDIINRGQEIEIILNEKMKDNNL